MTIKSDDKPVFDRMIEVMEGAYDRLKDATGTWTHKYLAHPNYHKFDEIIGREQQNIIHASAVMIGYEQPNSIINNIKDWGTIEPEYFNYLKGELERFAGASSIESIPNLAEVLFNMAESEILYLLLMSAKAENIPLLNVDGAGRSVGDVVYCAYCENHKPIVKKRILRGVVKPSCIQPDIKMDLFGAKAEPELFRAAIQLGLRYFGLTHGRVEKSPVESAAAEIQKMWTHAKDSETMRSAEPFAVLREYFGPKNFSGDPVIEPLLLDFEKKYAHLNGVKVESA